MAATDRVFLADRVKELSYDMGTGDLKLEKAAKGFGAFGDFYSHDDAVFYAITDGTRWEVGSGQYVLVGSDNAIKRFPFNSSNPGNTAVDFPEGVKEVYATYPGKFAVFTANGMDEFQSPKSSGIAFWGSQQTLDYDPNLVWDTGTDKLGIGYAQPSYQIDVAGKNSAWSLIRSSGTIVGTSGVMFSGVDPAYAAAYSGGLQLEPFRRNEISTETGSDLIISLSGNVDERILLRKQKEGQIWGGPASGVCGSPPCDSDYPQFRYLVQDDIPDLRELYVRQYNDIPHGVVGSIAFYRISGEIQYDRFIHWDRTNNYLGVNRENPSWELDVGGSGSISGTLDVLENTTLHKDLAVSGNVVVSGNLDVQGNVTYIDSATMTLLDPQLQLGSLSGTAVYTDAEMNEGGIVLQTTDSTGDKEWVWKDAIDSWDTEEGIRASGDVVTSGALTVASDVVFAENLTTSGTIGVSGAAQFDDTLKASGAVLFGDSLRVNTDFETSGTLNASGNSIFDGNVTFQKNQFVTGDSYFTGSNTVSGNLSVSGHALLDDVLKFTDDHIRIGDNAGTPYDDAEENIHIGKQAGSTASGERTIAIGHTAGLKSSGNYSLFVGNGAGVRSIGTLRQAGFGDQAASHTSGCLYSLMGGYHAGYKASGCTHSVFWGPYAGLYAGGPGNVGSGLSESVAVGSGAGEWAKGKQNFLIGGRAGYYASGTKNVYMGLLAGAHVSGNSNVEISTIGASFLPTNTTTSNKLNIHEMIVGDRSTKRLAIGNVDATNLSPNATLEIVPNGTDVALLASGNLNVSGVSAFHDDVTIKSNTLASGTLAVSGVSAFHNDVTIKSNTLASGTLAVSGLSTLHGGLETYSGVLPAPEGVNTVINSSGLLTVPVYASQAAAESALPAGAHLKGVIAIGGSKFMICNGTAWLIDTFE